MSKVRGAQEERNYQGELNYSNEAGCRRTIVRDEQEHPKREVEGIDCSLL